MNKAEIEKEIERMEKKADEEKDKCSCKDRFSHLPEGYFELKAKLSQRIDDEKEFKEIIKDLRFIGRFKGIDRETDMAYRQGYNNALQELLSKLEDKKNE